WKRQSLTNGRAFSNWSAVHAACNSTKVNVTRSTRCCQSKSGLSVRNFCRCASKSRWYTVGSSVPTSGCVVVSVGPRGERSRTLICVTYQATLPPVFLTPQCRHEPSGRGSSAPPQFGQCSAVTCPGGFERTSRPRTKRHCSLQYRAASLPGP